MSIQFGKELRRIFDLAALRQEASKDLTAAQWKEFRQIKQTYDARRDFERGQHKAEYATRVEIARKRLINQAGDKQKDFKHRWFGQDRFDSSAINRQAHRNVGAQHQQLMSGIDRQEARDLHAFFDRCRLHHAQREKPKQDFNRAADRRQVRRRQRER